MASCHTLGSPLPWSQRFFLSREVGRKRKTSGFLGLNLTFVQMPGLAFDPQTRIGWHFCKHTNQYDWFVWLLIQRGHMIAKLPLVDFVIINLKCLTAGVCMKVRFKSKVTRGFSLSCCFAALLHRFADLSWLKENLWDQGRSPYFLSLIALITCRHWMTIGSNTVQKSLALVNFRYRVV